MRGLNETQGVSHPRLSLDTPEGRWGEARHRHVLAVAPVELRRPGRLREERCVEAAAALSAPLVLPEGEHHLSDGGPWGLGMLQCGL